MSDLYKEAIADATKLREIAEQDARNNIMEEIAPYIKKMIAKETANLIHEQEDPLGSSVPGQEEEIPSVGASPDAPMLGADAASTGDVATSAPVAPVSADVMNMPLPGEDGKITLDFDQLFAGQGQGDIVPPVDTTEVAPGEAVPPLPSEPAPVSPVSTASGVEPVPADAAASGAPAGGPEVPSALPPVPEEEPLPSSSQPLTEQSFKNSLSEMAMKINTVYHSRRVSDIMQEALKNRLFSLLEQLDTLVETGELSSKQGKLNEKRLEFLFLQLKEASLHNSYMTEKDVKDDAMTRSLKEYAAKLFESEDEERLAQDSQSSGKTGVPTHVAATDHAKKTSGVSPEVDDLFVEGLGDVTGDQDHGPEDNDKTVEDLPGRTGSVKAAALPGADGRKAKDAPWQEGEPGGAMKEEALGKAGEIDAEGHGGFGDSKEVPVAAPDMFFEIDEKELKEAVEAIRKEALDKKGKKLATEKPWNEGKPEGKSVPAKKNLKNESGMGLGMAGAAMGGRRMEETGADEMIVGGRKMEEMPAPNLPKAPAMGVGMEEDLVLNIELPGDLDDELAEFDPTDVGVDVSLSPEGEEDELGGGLGGEEEGPEGLSVGGEEEPEGLGGGEEDVLLTDKMPAGGEEEEEVEDEAAMHDHMMMEVRKVAAAFAKKGLLEARKEINKQKKLAESRAAELSSLKKEMVETNLFLSKLLYLNKFLQREDLSRKTRQQILEHLDRATTVAEAKETYTKIKKKLEEAAASRSAAPVVGSASKPTTGGSAKLTESVSNATPNGSSVNDPVIGTFEKWQILANIKKTDK